MRSVIFLMLTLAAQAATLVTGSIKVASGDVATGSCSIQATTPWTAAGGARIVGAPVLVRFTAGVFSVNLEPTDTASPAGQYYRVMCAVPLQTVSGRSVGPFTWGPRYWLVPTSPATTTIGAVELSTAPTWAQLLAGGVTWNQLLGQ